MCLKCVSCGWYILLYSMTIVVCGQYYYYYCVWLLCVKWEAISCVAIPVCGCVLYCVDGHYHSVLLLFYCYYYCYPRWYVVRYLCGSFVYFVVRCVRFTLLFAFVRSLYAFVAFVTLLFTTSVVIHYSHLVFHLFYSCCPIVVVVVCCFHLGHSLHSTFALPFIWFAVVHFVVSVVHSFICCWWFVDLLLLHSFPFVTFPTFLLLPLIVALRLICCSVVVGWSLLLFILLPRWCSHLLVPSFVVPSPVLLCPLFDCCCCCFVDLLFGTLPVDIYVVPDTFVTVLLVALLLLLLLLPLLFCFVVVSGPFPFIPLLLFYCWVLHLLLIFIVVVVVHFDWFSIVVWFGDSVVIVVVVGDCSLDLFPIPFISVVGHSFHCCCCYFVVVYSITLHCCCMYIAHLLIDCYCCLLLLLHLLLLIYLFVTLLLLFSLLNIVVVVVLIVDRNCCDSLIVVVVFIPSIVVCIVVTVFHCCPFVTLLIVDLDSLFPLLLIVGDWLTHYSSFIWWWPIIHFVCPVVGWCWLCCWSVLTWLHC